MPVGEGRTRPPAVAPARRCAYAVLRRVFEDGAWGDRALRGEAERLGLDPRGLPPAPPLPSRAPPRPRDPAPAGPRAAPRAARRRYRAPRRPPARAPRPAGDRRAAPRDLPARLPRSR